MAHAVSPDPMIGRRFCGAVVVRLIGAGGMGAVYEAEHPVLGRRYAVKVLLPELASHESAVGRCFQEARAAAAIDHPRIIPIIDCGTTEDGRPFQVMPFLEGQDLDGFCAEVGARRGHPGRLDVATAMPIFFQILDGLAAVHERGIVHRDLKGANIHVLPDGTIRILDFGIAKLFDGSAVVRTGTFQIMGTPGYMAPEQGRGQPIDERTDIWALGAVFYRALTGRLPFEGRDLTELLALAMAGAAPSPSSLVPEIPPAVSEVVLSCLAPGRHDRPHSVRFIAHALMVAVPGGRALLERVAPQLLVRSGPSDPTVVRETAAAPAAPSTLDSTPGVSSPTRPSRRRRRFDGMAAVVGGGVLGLIVTIAATRGCGETRDPRQTEAVDVPVRAGGAARIAPDAREP